MNTEDTEDTDAPNHTNKQTFPNKNQKPKLKTNKKKPPHFYLYDKSDFKIFSMYFKSLNTDMAIFHSLITDGEFWPKLKGDGTTLM